MLQGIERGEESLTVLASGEHAPSATHPLKSVQKSREGALETCRTQLAQCEGHSGEGVFDLGPQPLNPLFLSSEGLHRLGSSCKKCTQ